MREGTGTTNDPATTPGWGRPSAPGTIAAPRPPDTPLPPPSDWTARPPGWVPPPLAPAHPDGPGAPRPPRPPREADPAPGRLLAIVAFAGVTLDIGLRGGSANLFVALGCTAVLLGLLADRRVRRRPARLAVAATLVPVAFLALRASAWLATTNLIAAAVLVTLGVAFSRSGSPADTTLARVVRRALGALPSAATAPAAVGPALPTLSADRTQHVARVGKAVAICVPVLAIVVALLAASDAVFAGLLSPDVHLSALTGHVLGALVCALLAVATIGAAASDADDARAPGRFGSLEIATMLTLTAVVLGLFVVAQLVALTSAGHQLVAQSGLTPAEYARSGFFQLCWATGLILSLLAGIRALAAPEVMRARGIRVLAALVPLLALGLVVVSLRRMALYDDAFGLTMLRLWVMGGAAWMGVVLIAIAVRNAGAGAAREWVLAATAITGLLLVVAADVANPEALVARHNLTRGERGEEVDAGYLAQLSDDATPTIVAAYEDGDAATQQELRDALRCGDEATGAAALNVAAQRAIASRHDACAAAVTG